MLFDVEGWAQDSKDPRHPQTKALLQRGHVGLHWICKGSRFLIKLLKGGVLGFRFQDSETVQVVG